MFGVALWSQLTIGWQWSAPDTDPTVTAEVVMSLSIALMVALAVAAAVPVIGRLVSGLVRRRAGLVRPTALLVTGVATLVVGGRHFGNGWPGTGGHHWAHQGLAPGGVAAFGWASTLSVSSYWAHPTSLLGFPLAEVAWMALSPAAGLAAAIGAVKMVRRVELSPRILRYEARIAALAVATMVLLLAGASAWVIDGGPGPRNLFHVGAIDAVGLVVMTLALVVAGGAARAACAGALGAGTELSSAPGAASPRSHRRPDCYV